MLWLRGYPTHRYLTFKQALESGGHVRKGEHGTHIYYVQIARTADTDEVKHIPFLKEYTVSNVAQCALGLRRGRSGVLFVACTGAASTSSARSGAWSAPASFPLESSIISMRQALHSLHIQTKGKGLVEIGGEVSHWLRNQNISTGLLTIFCRHTSASLLIQENADPDVRTDLENFFEAIAPEDNKLYVHRTEGLDDMPAHIRAALSQTQLAVPIASRRMVLGTWQGIYLFEHRRAPHRREVVLHLLGE